MTSKSKSNYSSVPQEGPRVQFAAYDSCSTLDGLGELDTELLAVPKESRYAALRNIRPPAPTSRWLWIAHAVLLSVSSILFILAATLTSSTIHHVREFSAWSPADVSIQYDHVKYNVTTKGNKFVGAGPEVDQAWREISYDMGDQWMSKSDITKLGMPESHLKVDHPTTGVEGYRVGMEVFHQLHCINLLRRVTYKEYYEPLGGEFGKGEEALRHHTDHCIEILRLNTQCNADIGLFTFYMVEGDPLAWPELNSKHVCRNFDKVMDWALENSVGNMEILQ